ncbi:MAG: hypothetical protein SVJ22_02660 [Halobacteriota archaeon]|nr:hypothetical protein [Halobacteriota archaeon]
MWDGSEWVSLEITIDMTSNTATAKVSHFSTFALFTKDTGVKEAIPMEEQSKPTDVEETIDIESIEIEPTTTLETPPEEEIPAEEGALVLPWIFIIIMVILVLVVVGLVLRN